MASESAAQDYSGPGGIQGGLSDWMSPYEGFRLEFDDVFQSDDKLVFLVRQIATTKHSGVEVETPSASVWWPEAAGQPGWLLPRPAGGLKAAGIDPDRPSRD